MKAKLIKLFVYLATIEILIVFFFLLEWCVTW